MSLPLLALLFASQAIAQPAPSKPQYSVPPQLATVVSSGQFVTPLPPRPTEDSEIAQIHANQQQINENCYKKGGTLDGLTCVLPPPPPPPTPVFSPPATSYTLPADNYKALIYERESGNNPGSINRSSGACGLGQALPCSKLPCSLADYACQDQFFTSYMLGRYGSWQAAWAHEESYGWW